MKKGTSKEEVKAAPKGFKIKPFISFLVRTASYNTVS
jgi:hypothetical protein